MRRFPITTCLTATLLVLGACGGGDDDAVDDAAAAAGDEAAGSDDATDDQADEPAADQPETDEPVADQPADEPVADEPAADPSGGSSGGTATLTLANGESFEFSILCMLESQVAAGSEILFTVVSYDDTGLDITQFGDEAFGGSANITVYDSSYDTLWDAGTLYDPFGGTIELSLDGSTVNGSGSFYPAGDITAEPVDGEIVASC